MKLVVYPSYFNVLYDNFYQKSEVKKFLTIAVPGAKYTRLFKNKQWDGTKCFYDFRNNAVPIGFLARFIKKFEIKPDQIDDKRVYKQTKFQMPELFGIELRDYQRTAIFDCFDNRNCLIQAATNAGKSAIIAGVAKTLQDEGVLILTHRKEILWQLKKMIEDLIGFEIGNITADDVRIHPKINIAMILTLVNRLDTDDAITQLLEKSRALMIDECFTWGTKVELSNGRRMRIGQMVKRVLAGEKILVKSYNAKTCEWEDRRVVRGFVNKHDDGEWVRVLFESRGGSKIVCTPNHKFYLHDGYQCQASDLRPGDLVRALPDMNRRFSNPCSLGDWQEQLIRGGIIGDLGVSVTKNTARVRIVHGLKQEEYFHYKMDILKNMIRVSDTYLKTEFSPKNGIIRSCTVSSRDIFEIAKEWKDDLDGFLEKLDDRGWAFAYMDDGCTGDRLCLNWESRERAEKICEAFNRRFGVSAFIRNQKGLEMIVHRRDMKKFSDRCGCFFHPSMRYKIDRYSPPKFVSGYCDAKPYAVLQVKRVEKVNKFYENLTRKYNIEVEGNHNYVVGAGRALVSNCHHGQSVSFQSILRRSPAVYRFGFSGTVQDEDSYDGWQTRMYIGDVVFNITNEELIGRGVSAKPKIYIHRIIHAIDYPKIHDKIKQKLVDDGKIDEDEMPVWVVRQEIYKRVYLQVLNEYVIRNPVRNEMIASEVCGTYSDKQVLIVVDYLEHGEILYDMLWERTGRNVAFIHGTSETRQGSLDSFKKGNLRVLISSNIIDEGIDISMIQMLFLAGGKKSRRQILQRIGRGLRRKEGENTVSIHDFYDQDGKHLEKHSRERLKIYRRENFDLEII